MIELFDQNAFKKNFEKSSAFIEDFLDGYSLVDYNNSHVLNSSHIQFICKSYAYDSRTWLIPEINEEQFV